MTEGSKLKIFLTGATGYIGGSVLWRLLSHKDAGDFDITVLVRNPEKAKRLEEGNFNVRVVIGSHSDHDKIEQLVSEADFVFACADVDDKPAAEAILRGLKKHKETTGKAPFLIHTSGTGVLADNAAGMYPTDRIYNDASVEDIESLPVTQIHRPVDLAVVAADQEGYVKTYIILPSTIYGIVSNPLVDAGVQNPHSIQVPQLIRASIDRRQGGMVGLGKNIWPNVDNGEVADLYMVLFNRIRADPEGTPHGREGFFFGANGEHTLYDVGKKIAEVLVELGVGQSPEPTSFTEDELEKYFQGPYLGSNSRCRADRSRSIGWAPKKTTADFLASIKAEAKALLELDKGKGYVPRNDGGKSK